MRKKGQDKKRPHPFLSMSNDKAQITNQIPSPNDKRENFFSVIRVIRGFSLS